MQRKTKKFILFLVLGCLLTGLFCLSFAEEGTDQPQLSLQLKPTEVNLQKGRSSKISASLVNNTKGTRLQKYEWVSSDPDVAECSGGTVKGLAAGSAVITCTATLSDGTVLTAECPVSVTVPVTGIQAEEKTLTVMAGDTVIPKIEIIPEDATNPAVQLSSSDEKILSVGKDGSVTGVEVGRAVLSAVSEDNPAKKISIPVTVTRRIGKTDNKLTFLGIPWGSDCETCISLLKEKGFIAEDARSRCSFTGSAWHWPENDLLFSRVSSWRSLPVSFSDKETGAARTSLKPLKTVGGHMPQTATLIFLNGIGDDGQIDPDSTRLIGVYFNFDNLHEKGTTIFCDLLNRLKEQYGEFRRYQEKDIPRYYPDLYAEIREVMTEPREYAVQEPETGETYLGEYALCIIRGADNTGIMLNMDTNGSVTLFYGRTDAVELIEELQQHMSEDSEVPEDIGV